MGLSRCVAGSTVTKQPRKRQEILERDVSRDSSKYLEKKWKKNMRFFRISPSSYDGKTVDWTLKLSSTGSGIKSGAFAEWPDFWQAGQRCGVTLRRLSASILFSSAITRDWMRSGRRLGEWSGSFAGVVVGKVTVIGLATEGMEINPDDAF